MKTRAEFRNRTLLLAAAILLPVAISCGPSVYFIDVETRQPSPAGVDLVGKTISVVYLDAGSDEDSLFSATLTDAFVRRLERDYFDGDSLISVFCLDRQDGVDYSSKTEMVDLLVETGSDVLFLFEAPAFGTEVVTVKETGQTPVTASAAFPFSISLHVYDSMDKRDTVRTYSGNSVANVSAQITGTESAAARSSILKAELGGAAATAGESSGSKFSPRWDAEQIMFFLFSSSQWYDTYYYVEGFQWQKAMDVWMSMLGTDNLEKKACLEYNMAAACYVMGQYSLATEWLDLSAGHFSLPYTQNLKRKIENRLER